MNFDLKNLSLNDAAKEPADALIVLVGTKFNAAQDPLSSLVAKAIEAEDFSPQPSQLLCAYDVAGVNAPRVIFAGCADATPQSLRQTLQAALNTAKASTLKNIVIVFPAEVVNTPLRQSLHIAMTCVAECTYTYTSTKPSAKARKLKHVCLGFDPHIDLTTLKETLRSTQALIKGTELAKEWANRPGNHATPTLLADAAKNLAKKHSRIKTQILHPSDVKRLGMGSFMAVAQGSQESLRFIIMSYEGATKHQAPVVLVGKGITFDSGGISLKPGPEMDEMKFDMSGAASVLGVMHALGELKPEINVVGLIPACENMPSGNALKPGDVITSMSGQTIEVLNTDAEGRLILCDALTYAQRFKPCAMIDIATLTGACVIALGGVRSGLFSNHDALAQALLQAGEESLDLCWRMPLDEEYAEGLKSNFADVANIAGRAAGSVTAAKFLQRFTEKTPWAHLDIAGTAWKSGAQKGATGRPVGLLLRYLLNTMTTNSPAQTSSGQTSSTSQGTSAETKTRTRTKTQTQVKANAKTGAKTAAKTSVTTDAPTRTKAKVATQPGTKVSKPTAPSLKKGAEKT